MALPTVEFVVAPATEAFRANPRDAALTDPIRDVMNSCQGMIRCVLPLILKLEGLNTPGSLLSLFDVSFPRRAFSISCSTTFGLQHDDKKSAHIAVGEHSTIARGAFWS